MKTTVAVLGAGGWGANWSERALRDPDCEVRAIADANPEVLRRLASRGIPRDRLFSSVDAALDAGPTDMVTCSIPNPHREPALARAMAEGRHLLVDKPLVHTPEALRTLLGLGAHRAGVFLVAQNYRYFAGAERIRKMLSSGDVEGFGDIGNVGDVAGMHVHFFRSSRHLAGSYVKDLPGALAMGMEMCIHHFDLMRFFLGTEPITVTARGWRTPWSPGTGYDSLDVHLEFPGGVSVAYDATWGASYDATDWCGHWEIVAEGATISYGARERALRAYDREGKAVIAEAGPDAEADTKQSVDRVWSTFKEAVSRVQCGDPAVSGFCSLEDNAKSLGIAMAAARSIETGAPVDYEGFMRRNGLI